MSSNTTDSTSNSSSIHSFYLSFQEEHSILDDLIEHLSIVPESQRAAAIDSYLLRINHLSDQVKDAASYLPPYDQRKYSEHIKGLSDKLSHARKALAPKQKFSFKSKAKSTTPTPSSGISNKPTPTPTPTPTPPPTITPTQNHITTPTQNHITITTFTSQYLHPPPLPHPSPVSLSTLTSCFINFSPTLNSHPPSMLAIKEITTSILYAPSVSGPAHLTSIRNSILILNCAQFRMHDTHNTDVYLLCPSRPIIEDCTGIRFAPLPGSWMPEGGGGNGERRNLWDQVDDFKWLRKEHSPNWRVIEEGERIGGKVWKEVMEAVGKTAIMVKDRGDGVMSADMDVGKVLSLMRMTGEIV